MAVPTSFTFQASTGRLGIASNGTTLVTIYTFSASLKNPDGTSGIGGRIKNVRLYNSDSIAHIVKLHLVPSAGSAGVTTVCEYLPALQPNEVAYWVPPGGEYAASSDFLQIVLGEAHASTAVYARAVVTETA